MCLDGVFRNEKLRGDLAIAQAAGDQGENFELACRDAESLLAGSIRSEGFEGGGFCGDRHFLHHDRFADGFAPSRDAEAEPDAEGCEEDGDERAVEFDRVLDDDEAVFGVLEAGDEEAADETEDEDVALHDGVEKKYNGVGEEAVTRSQKTEALRRSSQTCTKTHGLKSYFRLNSSLKILCATRWVKLVLASGGRGRICFEGARQSLFWNISAVGLFRSATLIGMRPHLLTSALFLVALSHFASAQVPTPVASRLAAQNALFDDSWQATLKMNPTLATAVGDYRYNDQLGDYSLAASATRHQREMADLASIKAIDPTGFPEQDRISHDLFLRQLQQRVDDYDLKEFEMPLSSSGGGGGIHASLADLPLSMPLDW